MTGAEPMAAGASVPGAKAGAALRSRRPRAFALVLIAQAAAALLVAGPSAAQPAGAQEDGADGEPGAEAQPASVAADTERELAVRVGYGRSDNLGQTGDDEAVAASYTLAGTSVGLTHERARLRGQVAADFEYRRYSEAFELEGGAESDDDELFGALWGDLAVEIVPETFAWRFEQTIGQVRRNPFRPTGPGNRERVSVFSTGPVVDLPLGDRTELRLVGRIDERRFEDRGALDSRNTFLSAGVARLLRPTVQVGVDVSQDKVDFDADRGGYKFENASVWYGKELVDGRAGVRVGEGKVTVLGESTSTELVNVFWERDIAARSSFDISVSRELTDAGRLFKLFGTVEGFGGIGGIGGITGDVTGVGSQRLAEVIASDSPAERTTLGLGYDIEGRRTNFSVRARAWRDRFEGDAEVDNDGTDANMTVRRGFGRYWQGEVQLRRSQRDFVTGVQEDDDRRVRLAAMRSVGVRGTVQFATERRSRGGDNTLEYDENLYTATFGFAFR